MAAQLDEHKVYQGTDGKPLVDGYLYIGVQGADPVTSPGPIFADRDLSIPLANPQRLDVYGKAANKIWVPGRYSWKVEDVNFVQQAQSLDAGDEPTSGVTTLGNVQGINAITAQAIPAITSYVGNQVYVFTAAAANTGAVTLDAGGGALPFRKDYSEDFIAGEIEAGQVLICVYSSVTNDFRIPGPNVRPLDAWKMVATHTTGIDLNVEFFHDGIENNGAAFVDGYQYRIGFDEVYGTVNDNFMFFELFENGAYRQTAASYLINGLRVTTTTPSNFSVQEARGYAACGRAGTSQYFSHAGGVDFFNLASSQMDSRWAGSAHSLPNAGIEYGNVYGKVFGPDLLRVSTKLRIFLSNGTLQGGTFTLWRRLAV